MAVEVFKLFGSIFVDTNEADKSIAKTEKKSSGLASSFGRGIKTAAKWGTAVVGGATLAAGGLMKMAESSAETTDKIDKMSQKIGISRKSYQELDFICSQTGANVDSLKNGLKTMRSVMDTTAQGTSKTATALQRLGISATNSDGSLRNSEEVMWDSLQALQSMKNETEKARIASLLFGKAGSDLMPLLNGSAESIEGMKKQAHELGLVLNDEAIDSGVEFSDTLDQTKRALSSIGTKLGASIMPIITNVMKKLQSGLPYIQNMFSKLEPILTGLFDKFLPPLINLGSIIFPILMNAIEVIVPLFAEIVNAIMPIYVRFFETLLPPFTQIISELLPPLVNIIIALLPLIQTIFDLLQPIVNLILQLLQPLASLISNAINPLIEKISTLFNDLLKPFIPVIQQIASVISSTLAPIFEELGPIFDTITQALSPIFEIFSALLNLILPALVPIISALATVFSTVFRTALEGVKTTISGVINVFRGIIDFITSVFTGDWKRAWNGIKKIFKGVWDSLFGIIKVPINLIIDGVNFLWKGVYNAVKGIVDNIGRITGAIGDLFGQEWHFSMPENPPSIPKLEEGGVLEKGQVGLLEGDGDEAVVPLSQNTEWLDKISDKIYKRIHKNNNNPLSISQNDNSNIENSPTYNVDITINGIDIYNDEDIIKIAKKLSAMFAAEILKKGRAFT